MDDTEDVEKVLSLVDNRTFDEDDWNVLISECHLLAAHWDKIAGFLGLDSSSIEVIKGNNPCNLAVSWNEALNQWIKQNYNTSRYGEPSWRSFLRAVVKVDKLQFKKMAIRHAISGQESQMKMEFDKPKPQVETASDTPEYSTMIECTPQLKAAVKNHLVWLSGHLLARRMISDNNNSDLMNGNITDYIRAAQLVQLVQDKVAQNPEHYHVFVEILENDKNNMVFKDVLKTLKEKYGSLKGGAPGTSTVGTAAGGTAQPHSSSDEAKEDLLTWLTREGISQNDCKILKDNEINREAFKLLKDEDLKALKLSYGAQIIIKKLLKIS